MDVVTCRVKRRPQLFVGAFGLLMLLIAALLLPGAGGWGALAIGAICLLSCLSALRPSLGYVRFSPDGLTVKYVTTSARTVSWRDIASVTSEAIRQIRHTVPCMVVTYVPGYNGKKIPQVLHDGRTAVGNFTTATGEELAAHGRDFLARYGG